MPEAVNSGWIMKVIGYAAVPSHDCISHLSIGRLINRQRDRHLIISDLNPVFAAVKIKGVKYPIFLRINTGAQGACEMFMPPADYRVPTDGQRNAARALVFGRKHQKTMRHSLAAAHVKLDVTPI